MNEVNDFGFTFSGEPEVDDRAERLLSVVNKFLDNLKKTPKAITIKWPNRTEEIETFQKRLSEIVNGETNGKKG